MELLRPMCSKNVKAFTDDETKFLLDKYATYLPEIGPLLQFRSKKDMWMRIAAEMGGKNWKQCEERYKTVKRRKKRRKMKFADDLDLSHEIAEEKSTLVNQPQEKLERDFRKSSVCAFTDAETKFLLDKYATYLPEIGPLQQLRSKKDMWMRIATEMGGKTYKQCEERYKTVKKRRKKTSVDNNNTFGGKRLKIEFEEEPEQISRLDDFAEPAIPISSQSVNQKCSSEAKVSRAKQQASIQETLYKIAERKEEAKQRRHQERMERADRIELLLMKITQAIQISSQNVINKSYSETKFSKTMETASMQETLHEIAVKKEEAKQRRHQERMERVDRMEHILMKLAEESILS